MNIAKSVGIIMASATMSLAYMPLSAYAASASPALQASASSASANQNVQYTVNDPMANSSTEYQFWVQAPNGQWRVAQHYSRAATFTLTDIKAGTYEVVAYALNQTQRRDHKWTQSIAIGPDSLFVGASVSVQATDTQSTAGPVASVTVHSANIASPLYQLWWKTPGGTWNASGPYQTASAFTFPLNKNGAYQFIAFAKPADAQANSRGALSSSPQSMVLSGNIAAMHTIQTVASTVNSTNGDTNPYGLAFDSYTGTSSAPNPYYGDFLVSNFSNKAGVGGAGSTIEAINPQTGSVKTFSSNVSAAAALAVSPKGPLWVADFGTTGTNGNVAVLTPAGGEFPSGGSLITGPDLDGPWGQVFVPNTTAPAFFVANALNGTIDAMYGFAPPDFNTDTHFAQIGSGLAHLGTTASTVEGPQGMTYDAATHMVYVTDSADNSIRGYYWQGPSTPNQGQGQLIYQGGALQKPAGITVNPLNGDLLVVNQGNNNLVEIDLNSGHSFAAGEKVLDHTGVNPLTGAGSALFGVDAVLSNGQLSIYFTNDNANTLDVLK